MSSFVNPIAPGVLHLFVEGVDAAIERAGAAGGDILMTPTDMFWGVSGAVAHG